MGMWLGDMFALTNPYELQVYFGFSALHVINSNRVAQLFELHTPPFLLRNSQGFVKGDMQFRPRSPLTNYSDFLKAQKTCM